LISTGSYPARSSGITVAEFWDLTPREVSRVEAAVWRMEQEQARALSLAWHVAALQRQKTLPSLARLLAVLKPRKAVPIEKRREEFELKARMMMPHRSDMAGETKLGRRRSRSAPRSTSSTRI
jgi:hypothetical protein